jgi:hypothetical protein
MAISARTLFRHAPATLVVLLGLGVLPLSHPAQAEDKEIAESGRPAKGPALPFEVDFAQRRHDRAVLSFNDHIATVPGNRIRDLPVVNGRMGDRVVLGEGASLFFPVGYLVTAVYHFDKLRAKAGVVSPAAAADLEPNPDYALVKRFDSELGPVCATTEDKASQMRVDFRIKPGSSKLLSVVLDQPGRWDGIAKESSRSYLLVSGTEERYLVNDPLAKRLLTHCRSGAKDPTVASDGTPISITLLTGTDPTQGPGPLPPQMAPAVDPASIKK